MKTEEIDILKLYSGLYENYPDARAWNKWLQKCLVAQNLNQLMSVRRGLQMGIATVEKQGLMNEQIAIMFSRWIGSIDKTIRKIVKIRNPMLNDNTKSVNKTNKSLEEKRKRDIELEKFLKKNSY